VGGLQLCLKAANRRVVAGAAVPLPGWARCAGCCCATCEAEGAAPAEATAPPRCLRWLEENGCIGAPSQRCCALPFSYGAAYCLE
jgi:hypothetical protein